MIVVGTTIAPYKCNGREELAWLKNAQAIAASVAPEPVRFFAALETDGRGMQPYEALLDALWKSGPSSTDDVNYWRFAFDDKLPKITGNGRLIRICMGRNMVQEYAQREGASHIYFADSDTAPPADVLPKLLELGHPIVGANVGIYALDGPQIIAQDGKASYRARGPAAFPPNGYGSAAYKEELDHCLNRGIFDVADSFPYGADVRAHWNTAGSLLVERKVFARVSWNYDLDAGNTDDPAYQRNVRELLGYDTWVRHDMHARHVPIPMVAVENRPGSKKHTPWV